MGISSYSTTPASNTLINGINIAEGCAPSNINDAIRQLMADVASGVVQNSAPTTTGSANAYVVTLTPAPTSYYQGLIVACISNFANTGAATINVNGLGAASIYKKGASGSIALTGSEIQSGDAILLVYDGTRFQLLVANTSLLAPLASPTFTGTPAAPTPTAGDSSTNIATTAFVNSAGIPIRKVVKRSTATGTYTPTANMVYCDVELIGGGGGGGGGTNNVYGGGGAGGYCRSVFTAAQVGAGVTVTVGAGGATNSYGGNSTFLGMTAYGGAYGGITVGGTGGTSTGAAVSIYGANGDPGYIYAPTARGGNGGSTMYGSGGYGSSFGNSAPSFGSGYGVGGGGAWNNTGAAGSVGICIITEYLSA